MASKMNKNFAADIKGILDIEEDKITVEVDDIEDPINLADFFKEFVGKDIKISITNKIEL